MSSERMISDDAVGEETSQCNVDDLADEHAHPRVTAKKTFFDLHRHRRANNAEAAETDDEAPIVQVFFQKKKIKNPSVSNTGLVSEMP